jgi:DNA (cytosine-5)-methyltransferase 1
MMTAATLFSGIGAPETAMPHWRWPWHAEIEKFPTAVMARRHAESINLGDVTAHDFCERAAGVARPNVLIFGSPCQSFSVAGKRLGLDDPRGNLALCALGIVDRLKPGWFVFENVPGLLSSAEGRDFGIFLRTVDELGYSLAWTVLDAQYFGVAQRRKRVFAVGHIGDWRGPAAVLFEPEGLCGHYPPGREAGKRVAPTIASRPSGGLGTDFECDGGLVTSHDVAQPLLAKENSSHRADGFDASEDGTGRGTPLIAVSSKDYGGDAVSDVTPMLRAMEFDGSHANAGGQLAVAFDMRGREGGSQFEGPHETANIRAASGGSSRSYITGQRAVRRLTPLECERLQGFPDGYTLVPDRGRMAADGPRYKALGNSMAVPVMRWILSRIEAVSEVSHAG